jgi:hypothetical protein
VQAEIKRRGALERVGTRYTNRYPFSGKLICGLCDAGFVSRPRKSHDGKRDIQRWQCGRYFKYGAKKNDDRGCENQMIRNEVLEYIFSFAMNDAVEFKDTLINECVTLLSSIFDDEQVQSEYADVSREIKRLSNRIEKLIELRLDGEITKMELRIKREPLDTQITALKIKLDGINKNAALMDERDNLMDEIKNHISGVVHAGTFNGDVAKETLDKIIIYSKNKFDVYFFGLKGKLAFNGDDASGGNTYVLQGW